MSSNGAETELKNLRQEIAELSERLVVADREKAQAGELGLNLLKEKEHLESTYETLLKEHDSVKTELERAQQQLVLLRSSQRNAVANELDHELGLLEDSAKLEAQYAGKMEKMEAEQRHLQEQLNMFKTESERVQLEVTALQSRVSELETERRTLREELRELRTREQQLQCENCELEDENLALQKQVMVLKSAQIEFESTKMQLKGLLDEVVILQTAVQEADKLRSLAEDQVADALTAAQQEREQRLALKKEFEQLRNQEHLASLNSLYLGMKDAQEGHDRNAVKQLESSFIANGPGPKAGQDLFSELHGDLANQLESLGAENRRLEAAREEQMRQFGQMLAPLFQSLKLSGNFEGFDLPKLREYMALAMERLEERNAPHKETKAQQKRMDQMKDCLRQTILMAARKEARLANSKQMLVQIGQALLAFHEELATVDGGEVEDGGPEKMNRRKHIAELATRLNSLAEPQAAEEGKRSPGSPDSELANGAADQQRDIGSPRAGLPDVCRPILSQHFLQQLAEQIGREAEEKTNSMADGAAKQSPPAGKKRQLLMECLEEGDLRERLAPGDGQEEGSQLAFEATGELLRAVRAATENRISAQLGLQDKDKADLYQTISKLKSLLAVKREQVSSLRTVLRSNKSSTEGAIQCLREKFESEKRLKDETMEVLRSQLKQFKEDAATFASHRAMFTARCEELQQQVESLHDSLKMAEEEKKTLNQLLRMSIQQKLQITQRVEELEMAAERHYQQHRDRGNGGGGGGIPGDPGQPTPQQQQQKRTPTGGGGGQRGGQDRMTRIVRYPASTSSTGHQQQNGSGPRGKQ